MNTYSHFGQGCYPHPTSSPYPRLGAGPGAGGSDDVDLAAPLPASVDLRGMLPPAYYQGSVASCVGNAIAGAVQYCRRKQHELPDWIPSRLFVYYDARAKEVPPQTGVDGGTSIVLGLQGVENEGVCPETIWPYSQSTWAQKPGINAYYSAKHHRTQTFRYVPLDLFSVKQALAAGFPVIFGFVVRESFYATGPDGLVPLPDTGEHVYGGHAVLGVGYRADDRVIIRNSWGPASAGQGVMGWGDQGHGYLPKEWFARGESYDGHTIHAVAA